MRLKRCSKNSGANVAEFHAILFDPPWRFKNWRSHKWWKTVEAVRDRETGVSPEAARAAEKYYPTLSLDMMKNLNVQSVMAKDCAVFMWITWPIRSGFRIGAGVGTDI